MREIFVRCINIYELLQSNDIYVRFNKIRIQKGFSLYAIAKKAGFTSEALYKWRDRKTTPSLYLLESICYALDIQIVDLLYDEPTLILCNDTDKELFRQIGDLTNLEKMQLSTYIRMLKNDRIKSKNNG